MMRRSAALPRTWLDPAIARLSRSANHSLLWFAAAGLLALRKGSMRRGGLRGVAAIAGASAVANLIGKPIFPRRRPAAELLPEHRRLEKRPTSSSFPSGHSASAAAFATAVAMENPAAGAALAPLAAAVAYSRVHTGVHWPTDVVAGLGIGVGVAAATRHWWPRTEVVPAQTGHRVQAPALGDGDGLVFLANPASGPDDFDPADTVKQNWPAARIVRPDPARDLIDLMTEAVDDSVRAVGVAGGDGTVAAVASVAAERDLPLVLLPAGTLNHFARDVGVATVDDAVAATASGSAVGIDLGRVDVEGDGHRWFVNTASLGGYPEMVRMRERMEHRLGKWLAAGIAMARVLRRAQPIPVLLNGERRVVWMLFLGNGSYLPKGFAPSSRPALDSGCLDVRYVRADVPYSRARFVIAALTRTLRTSHVYRQADVRELRVELVDGHRRVATDGEVGPLGNTFLFQSRSRALVVYRP
jgi:undecaprenyl-diphosphatase